MGQTVFLSAQSGWYDPAWKYRQEITIDSASLGMGGNLSAFPFLIKITGANNLFTSAQSDGDDILFTTSDGTTKIPHEIEYYEDTGSTELDAWVKVQTLYAGSDTVIYMYYGNSAASNQEDAENVWDSDYAGVWHLNEAATDDETTAIHYDSTANQSHGSQHGNGTLQAGKIAQAQEFDGSDENVDDYIDVNNFDTNSWSALTVEVWYNWSGNYDSEDGSTYFRLICKANGTSGDDTLFTLFKLNDPLRGQVHYNSTVYGRDGANMTAGGWHYAVLLWDGVAQELSVYMDGSSYGPEATAAGPLPDSPADQNLLFGDANAIDPDRSFMGSLDEIRISHSRRSNAWLAATYNNQNNPSSYCTFREEIVISGTVYTGEGTSPVGAGKTVALSVNGGTVAGTSLFSGDTDSNGMYELIVPTANIAAGNAILLFIDGETEKGATVSVTDGGNLAGMDIYQNHVIVRHDNGGSMSNTIMAAAHNGDTDIPYSQATPAVTTNDGTAFYVPAGQTFQQNGNLSAGSSAAANVKIQGTFNAANTLHVRGNVTGSGTLNGGTAAIDIDGAFGITAYNATTGTTSVGGDWTVGGFTHNSGTVAFDGTGVVASESFSTLRLNGGTRTATGALTITAGLILASGSFSPGTYNHAVAGNWNDSAVTFIPPAGTITLTSTNAQITQGGTNNFHNLAVSDGAALLSSINVDGDLAISSGDLDDNGYDITIIGSWNNAGAFTAETGCAVYFLDNTVTSTITGDNTFDEFYCNAAGKILEFEAGSLQTINVRFDIGVANGLLTTLKSTIPGIQWRIDSGGANNVNDVIVSDSDASPGPAITATNSVDEGNNLNWIINPDDDDYLWQGGDLGDPDNWQVAANWDKNAVPGGLASDRAVIPASASVMPVLTKNLDTPAPGDTAKIFINDGAILDTNGFDIINPPVFEFENFGIIRKRTGDTITLSDTNSGTVVYYDASGGAIQDYGATDYYNLGFDGSGQTFTLGANLVVAGDLEITAGTFDPGAYSVTVYGDLVIRAGGAMDAGSGTLTVGGDVYGTGILRGESASIDVTGDFGVQTYSASTGTTTIGGEWGVTSFSHNTGTVSFDAGGTVPAITFYNLGVSAGTRTASGNLTVQGNLTINNPGSLSMSGHNLAVAGNLGGTGTLAGGSGTIDVNGSLGVANYTATSGYTYAGGNWNVTGSFVPGTGTVICDGAGTLGVNTTFFNLTIPSGASFDTGGNSLDISNTFEVQGILYRRGGDTVNRIDTDSGTVTYRTSGGNIQTYTGNDYYNLTIDEAGQTFSLPAGIGVANNLAISNGTLNPNNHTITVGGSWSNAVGAVGFTYGTSTVTFTDASRISVVSGTTTFSNLTCSTPSKTIRFESGTSQTITDSFVIQGELGGYVTLEGTSAATWTLVNSTAAGTADYAAIQYSTVSAPSFTASNSMDNGNNNANWIFSGTVYRWVSSGSTSWTTAANWSPSTGYPQTNDTAIIQATGAAPALAANRTVTNLEIREGAALDIAGYTLTINGSFENRGTLRRYRTASSIENKCTKTDTDSGTVQYISGGAGTMIQDYGSPDYYNLILDIGGSVTVQRSLTVTGDFGFTSGTTVNAGTNFIAVGGNWTNGGGTLNHSSTVYFNDDTRTSTISGNTTFNNLSCTSPGKTILFEGTSTQAVNGTFTIQGAVGDYVILDSTDANQWIINTVNADVDYARVQDSDITNATVITADSSIDDGNNDTESGVDAGRWSFPGGTTFFTWTGSGGDQNWDNTGNWSGGVDYPQAGDTAVIPATGNPPVMNADVTVETLTIQAGGSLDTDGYSLTVTGDFDNEGTLYRQGGDYVSHTDTDSGLTIYRTTGGTIQDYGSTGYDYYDLTIDGASFTLTGNLGVAGDLAFSGSGTLEQGGYSITAAGDVTGTGTLSGGTGTIDVNGNISVSTMTGTTGVASIAGDWNVGAFTHNGGTVRFDGSGTLTPGTGDFWNLENQTGTRTLSGTVTAANNLAISGGTLDAAGNTINVGGDWTNNGTFTHGNNTVIFIDENKPSAITGTTGFYNFTCSTPGKTLSFGANETQTIQNNFVIQGAAGDLIVLESTSGPTRWNILNTLNTENVDFADIRDSDNTGGDTITADDSIGNGNNINWTINQTFFTWVGGTGGALTSWNTGTNWFPQVVPGAGGTVVIPFGPAYMPVIDTTPVTVENITIEAGASLDTGGNTLTINSTFQNEGTLYRRGGDAVSRTDADSGAVVYGTAGGGIQTYAGPDYYDLQINGASQTFTLAASCEVANDIDIIAGTLSASGNTITLSGDWTVSSSALYTAGGGAVVFDSAAGQSCVTGGSEFANLTKQGGSRLTVASYNCTVSGTLTIGTAADIVDMTNR
ncbi:MAG: DUF2341 domain-containing protein, partial [Spirochaetales bacterium]|nr:DUF2341 domain-containing protein [Spirochaetales bacterium]